MTLWTAAAGLGACYACAHLDYRDRERAVMLGLGPPPNTPALYAAILLGVGAAMAGTAGTGLAIMETRWFSARSDSAGSGGGDVQDS